MPLETLLWAVGARFGPPPPLLCSALLCSSCLLVFLGFLRRLAFCSVFAFRPSLFFFGRGDLRAARVQAGFGLAVWSCRFSRPLPRDSTTIQERPGEPLYDSLSCPFAVLLGCSVTQHLSRDSDTVTRHTARPGDQLRSAHTFTILLVRHFATCSAGGEGPPKTPLTNQHSNLLGPREARSFERGL